MTTIKLSPEAMERLNAILRKGDGETAPQPEADRDIVVRLREVADTLPNVDHVILVGEAADEIERLRAALSDMVKAWEWWQEDTADRCLTVVRDAVDDCAKALT